ncbi:MAG TPA: hypothetical protein VFS00_05195 [Polyangiaceae bacterium]|nr:hypothetical protein [Polyangiaceae bacterium]
MTTTIKLRSLASSMFFAAAAFATAGLAFGCASPAVDESEGEEATGEQAQALCCIDYVCPVDGFETTGCKGGGATINSAFTACNNHCSVSCKSSGLLCD